MSEEELKSMRHSLAHIMAQAIQHLWPQSKFGVGPAIDNGFYYDIYLDNGTISEADLPKIEEEMRKIVVADYPFERRDVSVEEAIDWAISRDQSFKVELLNDLKRSGTTVASELTGEKMGSMSDPSLLRPIRRTMYPLYQRTSICYFQPRKQSTIYIIVIGIAIGIR